MAQSHDSSWEPFFDQVRERVSLAEFIAQYTTLNKAGGQYMGLCPLHNEKSPSFSVNDEKGVWHCFGCGKGGNLFTFLKEKEGLDFREAAELIADRFHIPLPQKQTPQQKQERSEQERLRDMHQAALEYYQRNLLSEAGRPFREYLKARDFGREEAERFRLGAALDAWDGLTTALTRQGFTQRELLSAGLCTTSEKNPEHGYDRFRQRLMIPICDNLHRPIAFGGRIVGEGEPKYLNSPETVLFRKNQTLFALDLAREAIRARGLVCLMEGYTDVMRAHQKGLNFVCAAMGTALTDNQIKQLARYTDTVVLVLDGDQAGVQAAYKHAQVLVKQRMKAKVAIIPGGGDPDDFLRAAADPVAAFEDLLTKALPAMEFMLRVIAPRSLPDHPSERVEAVEKAGPLIALLATRGERQEYAERYARRIGWDIVRVLEILEPWTSGRAGTSASPVDTLPTDVEEQGNPAEWPALERDLLRAMVLDGACREVGIDYLRPGDLSIAPLQRLLRLLADESLPTDSSALVSAPQVQILPQMQRLLSALITWEGEPPSLDHFKKQLTVIRAQQSREELARIGLALEEATRNGYSQRIEQLMRRSTELGRLLRLLTAHQWPEDVAPDLSATFLE